MSDLLSPLLFVLRDESLAYTCFLALISRCAPNFCVHSDSIALKIKLLGSLLARYDSELWSHLVQVGADQMLFVYRWLLLECKREFPFEVSNHLLFFFFLKIILNMVPNKLYQGLVESTRMHVGNH